MKQLKLEFNDRLFHRTAWDVVRSATPGVIPDFTMPPETRSSLARGYVNGSKQTGYRARVDRPVRTRSGDEARGHVGLCNAGR